jgi:hypothetical protein
MITAGNISYAAWRDGGFPIHDMSACDVHVDVNGVMSMTDTNAGLYILQYEGE